jgi:hypothetical protein
MPIMSFIPCLCNVFDFDEADDVCSSVDPGGRVQVWRSLRLLYATCGGRVDAKGLPHRRFTIEAARRQGVVGGDQAERVGTN